MDITLITPTGGRPEAFALCERWMSRQTYSGPLRWIVVDDCDPPTPCTMGQEVIRPEILWRPGDSTQHRNLLLLLERVEHGFVLFIEDDDYYSPEYVSEMCSRLHQALLVGEANARFYNVRERAYHFCSNGHHASLSQTGFHVRALPHIKRAVLSGRKFVDIELWQLCGHVGKIFPCSSVWVGVKGMPGRLGIGVGHKKLWTAPRSDGIAPWVSDSDLSVLKSWIGEDALAYEAFFGNERGGVETCQSR